MQGVQRKLIDRCWGLSAAGIVIFFMTLSLSGCGGDERTTIVIEAPPATPAGINVVITSSNTLTISWNGVANATSYNVYWSTTSGVNKNSSKISVLAATNYAHAGLTAGLNYYYVVTAVNSFGESSVSAEVFELLNTPRPPGAISVVAGDMQATLSWNSNGASSYNIYIASQPGVTKTNYASLANGTMHTGVTSPYVLAGLTNGTPYYLAVTGVNSFGESSESHELTVTPAATNGLTVSGTVKYEDKEYGTGGFTGNTSYKAVRFATVEAVDVASSTAIATGTTDISGIYSLTIPPVYSASAIYIRVLSTAAIPAMPSAAPPVSVKYLSNVLYAATGADFIPSGYAMANILIPVTSAAAGAFNILDVYTSGAQFARALAGTYPAALNAYWQSGSAYGTYYCGGPDPACPRGEGIYVLNYQGDSDEYDDDVLWHEYGHFIANKFSKDSSPGGPHFITSNDLDLRLSWSEGWGGFFPAAAKSWLAATTPALLSTTPMAATSLYVDTSGGGASYFDYGSPGGSPYIYSSCEAAVAKVLIDLRNIYGIQAVWDAFTSIKVALAPVNIEIFWDAWITLGNFNNTTILGSRSISYFPDSYEAVSDNVPDPLRKAVLGQAEAHTIFGSGDIDYIAFDAAAGQPFTVKTTAIKNGADTYISIIAPDKTTLLYNNDNSSGAVYTGAVPSNCDQWGVCHENGNDILGSSKTFTTTAIGTYYVKVESSPNRPLSAGKYGDYSLTITSP